MAATKYVYSVSTDFPNHKVDIDRLTIEIRASSITVALDRIEVSADVCDIWFKDALSSGDETILDGVVAAHSGEPLTPSVEPVQLKGFHDVNGYHYWRKGYRRAVTAGQTNNFDSKFDSDIYLCGGGLYVVGPSADGDYIECDIVDADGLYYPAETVLANFVKTNYVFNGQNWDCQLDDPKLIPTGIYIRFRYVSAGASDVVCYSWYHFRRPPVT